MFQGQAEEGHPWQTSFTFFFGTYNFIHNSLRESLYQPAPSTMKRVQASAWLLLPSPLVLSIFISNTHRHVLTPCSLGSWPGFSEVCPHTRACQKPLADVWRSGREGEIILDFVCLCAFVFAVRVCKLGSVPLTYSLK